LFPFLKIFWIAIVGLRVLFECIGGDPKARWVPRGISILIAGLVLFAWHVLYLDSLNFLIRETNPNAYGYRWSPYPYMAWPAVSGVALWVHLRASRARMGSVLLGWAEGILLLYLVTQTFYWVQDGVAAPSGLRSGTTDSKAWWIPAAARPGTWLALSLLLEMSYLLLEKWRRNRRGVLTDIRWKGVPGLAAVLGFGFFLVWTTDFAGTRPLAYHYQDEQWMTACLFSGLVPWLLVATFTAVAFADAMKIKWAFRSAGVGYLAGTAALLGGFKFSSEGMRIALPWAFLGAALVAESWFAIQAGRDTRSRLCCLTETVAVRTLLQFPRSPLRSWGIRPRWRALWGVTLLVFCLVLLLAYPATIAYINARGFQVGYPAEFRIFFWQTGGACLMLLGILVPLGVVVPWSIANRFQSHWKANVLSELSVAGLSPWQLASAVALPPALPYVILTSTCGVVLWVLWLLGAWRPDFFFYQLGLVPLNMAKLSLSLGAVLVANLALVVGFCRRRLLSGPAASAVSAFILILGATGCWLLPFVLWFIHLPINDYVLLSAEGVAALLTVRWALASLPESVDNILGK